MRELKQRLPSFLYKKECQKIHLIKDAPAPLIDSKKVSFFCCSFIFSFIKNDMLISDRLNTYS